MSMVSLVFSLLMKSPLGFNFGLCRAHTGELEKRVEFPSTLPEKLNSGSELDNRFRGSVRFKFQKI